MSRSKRSQFHLMMPAELHEEAAKRLHPSYQPTNWGQRLKGPVLLFAASLAVGVYGPRVFGPALFWIGFLSGVSSFIWLLAAGFCTPRNPLPDSSDVQALATRLSGCVRGLCPACEQNTVIQPNGTVPTVRCPSCGMPLRYDRGWMYQDSV